MRDRRKCENRKWIVVEKSAERKYNCKYCSPKYETSRSLTILRGIHRWKLCCKCHISYVSMKVSKIAGIIAKARHYLELKNLKEVCNTMVYPYLTYCNINWASTYPTRLRSIYTTQKEMLRLMTFLSFRETFQPLFKLLKIMNILWNKSVPVPNSKLHVLTLLWQTSWNFRELLRKKW